MSAESAGGRPRAIDRPPRGAMLLSWLLLPLALWQGFGVRRRTERLGPPPGAPHGCIGEAGSGTAPARSLSLLVIGDSSAAGVGADRMGETLAPQIAALLSERFGRAVAWRNAGANSAVSADVRDHVVPLIEAADPTHIVLSIGTNDAKNYQSRRRFKRDFGTLLYAVRTRWPDARIVWHPPIDLRRIPNLPASLASILEMRAKVLRHVGRQLCRERGIVAAPILPINEAGGFARDGFHASAEGYAYIAGHLARLLAEEPDIAPDA